MCLGLEPQLGLHGVGTRHDGLRAAPPTTLALRSCCSVPYPCRPPGRHHQLRARLPLCVREHCARGGTRGCGGLRLQPSAQRAVRSSQGGFAVPWVFEVQLLHAGRQLVSMCCLHPSASTITLLHWTRQAGLTHAVLMTLCTHPCLGCAQGHGAYRNGKRIHVSGQQELAQALLATEVGVNRDPATFRAVFTRVEALAKVKGEGCIEAAGAAISVGVSVHQAKCHTHTASCIEPAVRGLCDCRRCGQCAAVGHVH